MVSTKGQSLVEFLVLLASLTALSALLFWWYRPSTGPDNGGVAAVAQLNASTNIAADADR